VNRDLYFAPLFFINSIIKGTGLFYLHTTKNLLKNANIKTASTAYLNKNYKQAPWYQRRRAVALQQFWRCSQFEKVVGNSL
jgi:hypothetical protein